MTFSIKMFGAFAMTLIDMAVFALVVWVFKWDVPAWGWTAVWLAAFNINWTDMKIHQLEGR